jgi:UDP-N-acetylmuramate--alanine ligase
MDCYKDMADVERAFLDFMDKVPFYGAVTACIDNALLKGILPRARRRVFTYGVADEADFRVEYLDPAAAGRFAQFYVYAGAERLGPFELSVPGRHNVLNATAAVAIAWQLKVTEDKIVEGLSKFRGVDRRFQLRGQARGVTVVDDYGHHPTEIRATLAAARECGYKRIHLIFQPHRYTRTQDLMEQFSTAFADADTLAVLPIYAASEEPIAGVTAEALVAKIEGTPTRFVDGFASAVAAAVAEANEGDLILTLGAGSVSQLAPLILSALLKE